MEEGGFYNLTMQKLPNPSSASEEADLFESFLISIAALILLTAFHVWMRQMQFSASFESTLNALTAGLASLYLAWMSANVHRLYKRGGPGIK